MPLVLASIFCSTDGVCSLTFSHLSVIIYNYLNVQDSIRQDSSQSVLDSANCPSFDPNVQLHHSRHFYNEQERLSATIATNVLNTTEDPRFDAITK